MFIELSPTLTILYSDATRPTFSALLTSAISQSTEKYTTAAKGEEDSEDWLNVNAQDFDDMLEKTRGKSKSKVHSEAMDVDNGNAKETEEDRLATEQAIRLQDLAQKVESFVDGEGDMEGAKFDE